MSRPRTVQEVLADHVELEIESVDRLFLNLYQPGLVSGGGVHNFFVKHRGNAYPTKALMAPMTQAFVADVEHFAAAYGIPIHRFQPGESKTEVARAYLDDYLAAHDGCGGDGCGGDGCGGDGCGGVVFIGKAQEKAWVWSSVPRRNCVTGKRYSHLERATAFVNSYYFYCWDTDFGPVTVKFCSYFPFPGRVWVNGHEWAKRQAAKAGVRFTGLDNGFAWAEDQQALQGICDSLDAGHIQALVDAWLKRLPHPFTEHDICAGYVYDVSILQAELSTTQVLHTPVAGRIFFEQLIRDNLDIGRPDRVALVFDQSLPRKPRRRKPRTTGKNTTGKNTTGKNAGDSGRGMAAWDTCFATRIITEGVVPSLHFTWKKTRVKQYHKNGRALRTETTINNTRDHGIGKRLNNLAAVRQIGLTTNQRLLAVQRISHNPIAGHHALTRLHQPLTTPTGTRVAGLRFADPRVHALLAVLLLYAFLPDGFTNRDMRQRLAPLLGKTAITPGQATYDLRRLRHHGLIHRIPHTNRYQATHHGLAIARFYTDTHDHLLRTGLAHLTDPKPPHPSPLRKAFTDLATQAHLAA